MIDGTFQNIKGREKNKEKQILHSCRYIANIMTTLDLFFVPLSLKIFFISPLNVTLVALRDLAL